MHEDLLHNLARYRDETNWPVIPWIFFFSLIENGVYVFPFPVGENFPRLPLSHRYDGYQFGNYILKVEGTGTV